MSRLAFMLLAPMWMAPQAWAQDLPARKPGLWTMAVVVPGAPAGKGGAGENQQCIDARTDADLQRKAVQGGPGECSQSAVRKTAAGHEYESTCKTPQGRSVNLVRISGDPQSAYTVRVTSRHEPPRKDIPEHTIDIKATWAGACPAGMKPGDVRMAGASFNVNDMAGARKTQGMKPEELKKMLEQMKGAQGR